MEFSRNALGGPEGNHSLGIPLVVRKNDFYLEETQRAVQLMVEEDIFSIYQMPEINPDIRHAALFLSSSAACC